MDSKNEHIQELIKNQSVLISLLCMERELTALLRKELEMKSKVRGDLEATILQEVETILSSGQSCSCFLVRCETDVDDNDAIDQSASIHPDCPNIEAQTTLNLQSNDNVSSSSKVYCSDFVDDNVRTKADNTNENTFSTLIIKLEPEDNIIGDGYLPSVDGTDPTLILEFKAEDNTIDEGYLPNVDHTDATLTLESKAEDDVIDVDVRVITLSARRRRYFSPGPVSGGRNSPSKAISFDDIKEVSDESSQD